MQKFIATFDLHYGYERRQGHKYPLHDPKAWAAVIEFAKDFKPDTWIHGGDMLDCACVSHHTKHKPGQVEGMRLAEDAEKGRELFIKPVEEITKGNLIYMVGNHEKWLEDLTDEQPQLDGLVNIESLLKLNKWNVIEQGGYYDLGKLTFVHGDTIKGGEHVAKAAVTTWGFNMRFGHHHTYQIYTKCSPKDYKDAKTGISVPCLCTKSPKYGEGAPNRWVQGFLYGWVGNGGMFNDYVVVIIDGKFTVNGKTYKG